MTIYDDARSLEHRLIGESRVMRDLRRLVAQLARSSLPILIQGPRGAGKELVAEALHDLSGRPGCFVAFNVCAIPDTMFEDSLFGHVRGAFTGANTDSPGYLLEAHRGTVFLDEISGLGTAGQRKLLRVLETRVFRPVGGRVDRSSDFRLVAATNDDLHQLAAEGTFRDDLIDRVSAAVIAVPPLLERVDDVPALASHFLTRADPSRRLVMSALAVRELSRYDWPGNVRELRNVIARVVALAHDSMIGSDEVRTAMACGRSPATAGRLLDNDELREREILAAALRTADWDTDAVARELGVARSTVYRRMDRLGITLKRAEHSPKDAHTTAQRLRAVV